MCRCFAATAILLLFVGCAGRRPSPPPMPSVGRVGTPIENACAYNSDLAKVSKSIAQIVIANSSGGSPLIPVDSANQILGMQSRIEDADRQLAPLLSDVDNLRKNAARVDSMLSEIEGAVDTLDSSGDLLIKDVAMQKQIAEGISKVRNLAVAIREQLVQGGFLTVGRP